MLMDSTASTQVETPKNPKRDPLKGQKTLKVTSFLEEFEVDEIKKKVDIVELFESFGVKLTGKDGNFMGLCPFHEDKTPSLSVSREKGLFKCFSGKCGVDGSVVDVVMNFKNTDFKGAMNYLKEFKSIGPGSLTGKPLKSQPVPVAAGEKDSGGFVDLKAIQKHYHEKLYENPAALDYLKKRGFKTSELFERFQLGYSDGSLLEKLGEKQREEFKRVGILNEGILKEHFLNCLIFPIIDDNGQTVSFYGRCIDDSSSFKHRYLKGPHKGVFNRKASKVYNEIILTECIIDALSLVESGLENVQALYGTNGFTDEHLQILKGDNVKVVVLALDNDEAGQKASEKLKERLIEEGFKVKIVSPFNGKDWNEALIAGSLEKEALKTLIEQAAIFEAEPAQNLEQGLSVKVEGLSTIFTFNDLVYKVTGVKEGFVTSLRVNIKAESVNPAYSEEKYFDSIDICLSRARLSYASQVSRLFGVEPKRVEKDLTTILEYFEKERDRKLEKAKPVKVELTENDKSTGLEFLQSPDLFSDIDRDMTTLGYAGEEVNKQLIYLAGTSRLMSKPLSAYIQSGAGSGKSYLIDTVLKLMPPEKVQFITSSSTRAFNYTEEEKLVDCILATGEALHNEDVERDIRQMQSENIISRAVTQKDPKTGEMKTVQVEKKVRLSFMMTSTALKLNPENASRCLVMNVDESRAQTELVMEQQRRKKTFEGYLESKHIVPQIAQKHISAQRMLKQRNIFNPFITGLKFPLVKAIMRRAHEQFLTLIDSVAFVQQFKKTPIVLFDPYAKQEIEGLECDLFDYKTARRLFIEGGILTNIYDHPAGMVELYEEMRKLARKRASKGGVKVTEVSFIQSDIRELTDLSPESVKRYVRMLVEYEYLKIVGGKQHGTRFSYCLREDESIKGLNLSSMIPTAEEMGESLDRQEH